ncbi:MAG: AAA family ATPase [Lachnospiraceae bacterium]|nr:AAA family ATPase [Lachnospiraceae bacterium]
MNISITGTLGSGKSSVCAVLEKHGYSTISNGVLFREIAKEKGITVVELNELAKTDKSIDKMLDDRSIRLGKERENTIFDSRMGWHFIPDSFKVFLFANMNEAARRVYAADRISEAYQSELDAKADLIKRQLLEKERFFSLYGVDYLDLHNYDLVIESTSASPEQVAEKILETLAEYHKDKQTMLLNPTSIYPSETASAITKEELEKAMEGGLSEPIQIGLIQNNFCVLKGDCRLLSSILKKETFLSVNYQKAAEGNLPDSDLLEKFETLGEFTYKIRPEADAPAIFC